MHLRRFCITRALARALLFASPFVTGCASSSAEAPLGDELTLAPGTARGQSNLGAPTSVFVGWNSSNAGFAGAPDPMVGQLLDVVTSLNREPGATRIQLMVGIPEQFPADSFGPPRPRGEPLALWKSNVEGPARLRLGSSAYDSAVRLISTKSQKFWAQDFFEFFSGPGGQLFALDLKHPENATEGLSWLTSEGVNDSGALFTRTESTSSSAHGGNLEFLPGGKTGFSGELNPYAAVDLSTLALEELSTLGELDAVARVLSGWSREFSTKRVRIEQTRFDAELNTAPKALRDRLRDELDALFKERHQWERLMARVRVGTGSAPVAVDTSWLSLGHVDEVLAYVPAKNACGYALLWADPLEGLLLEMSKGSAIANGATAADLKALFAPSYLTSPEGRLLGTAIQANRAPALAQLEKGLAHLSARAAILPEPPEGDEQRQRQNRILWHLLGAKAQRQAVSALQQVARCRAPALAIPVAYSVGQSDIQLRGLFDSVGRMNLLVLRDHVLQRSEQSASLLAAADVAEATKRLQGLVGKDKLHPISVPSGYRGGALHCATFALRKPEL